MNRAKKRVVRAGLATVVVALVVYGLLITRPAGRIEVRTVPGAVPESEHQPVGPTPGVVPTTIASRSDAEIRRYWTPERMAEAGRNGDPARKTLTTPQPDAEPTPSGPPVDREGVKPNNSADGGPPTTSPPPATTPR